MTVRSNLPSRVADLLQAPANVAIHGSPGAGKSWIADRVVEELTAREAQVVRLDLSTAMSGSDVFVQIVPEGSCDESVASTRAAWRLARTWLDQVGLPTVLVLDQFDRVLQFEDAQEFLLLFRELVHRPASLPCIALICSRRSLQAVEMRISGISTLASICYVENLGSLQPDDVAGLVATGGDALTAADIAACLSWSGGNPFLSRYWLSTRPSAADGAAELQRAKVIVRVIEHLREVGLMNAAAQFVLGPIVEETFAEKQELQLLGILADADDNICLAGLEIFRDALRRATWDLDPWGIMGFCEVRLRGLIDSILSDRIGADWPDEVGRRAPAAKKAFAEANVKILRDQRLFGRTAPLLAYTYPGDLWTIIQSEWSAFSDVFNFADKAYWRKVLVGLAQYRSPLAHGRPEVLGDAQRAQCRVYADEVLNYIDRYEVKARSLSVADARTE